MKTIQCNRTDASVQHISFEVTDSRWREVGMRIAIYEVDFIEMPTAVCYYTQTAGHYFAFKPQATRDNKPYGASQKSKYFLDAETRHQAIEKYLAAARKRATK